MTYYYLLFKSHIYHDQLNNRRINMKLLFSFLQINNIPLQKLFFN